MLEKIGYVVLIVGYFIAGLSTISAVGYGLYNWGSVGLELGPSAWLGFVLFLKMLGLGVATAILGAGILYFEDQ